jgi:tRNA A37 threonylcarbamoyladenosine biosynthesis protein TsaE
MKLSYTKPTYTLAAADEEKQREFVHMGVYQNAENPRPAWISTVFASEILLIS